MILIDALYINNGGGKILLKLLIKVARERGLQVMYLLDKRIAVDFENQNLPNVTFLEASLINRNLYYVRMKKHFTSVFVFGNVPPTVRLKCKVFTYFHNVLFLDFDHSEPNINVLSVRLKIIFIKIFRKNTKKWIVQTNLMKDKLAARWGISLDDILIYPIYDDNWATPVERENINEEQGVKFIYASNGHFYKNHKLLIEAFSEYNKRYPLSSLILTIGEEYPILKNFIMDEVRRGVNIIDKGLLSLDSLRIEYENADVCIYPSLHESFGLGLIEAALMKMPICASDLPFVHEVVKPNSIFDPNSKQSILNSLLMANGFEDVSAELTSENKLEELIDLISN